MLLHQKYLWWYAAAGEAMRSAVPGTVVVGDALEGQPVAAQDADDEAAAGEVEARGLDGSRCLDAMLYCRTMARRGWRRGKELLTLRPRGPKVPKRCWGP